MCKKVFLLEILSAPWKKQWYCFFCGTPSVYHFHDVYCVLILGFYFGLSLPNQSACVKVWKYYVLHERNINVTSFLVSLCIAFWNYKVLWFLIAYFILPLATHIPDENFFISGNFWCSNEKAVILLLWGSTLYISFSMYAFHFQWILLVDFQLTVVA